MARDFWIGARRIAGFVALALLGACNHPDPHFANQSVTRVEVAGSVFDIRVRGRLAEAIRVNPQYAPRLGPLAARAVFAMVQVSGCPVRELRGDQAVTIGILACDADAETRPQRAELVSYSCLELVQWVSEEFENRYSEFDCDPV